MNSEFLCNFKKCRKALTSEAWVTSCSHIFCIDDGTKEFERAFICPACDTQLPGKYDIVKVDLNPSEQYKSMVLAGQRPEVVFEICSRAIAFWTHQVHQEIMIQEYVSSKAKERSLQLEKYYENILQKTRNELETVKQQLGSSRKELEMFKRKTAELSEKLAERNRQYQKLLSLYDALRRKFIPSTFLQKQEGKLMKSQTSFEMSTAAEIICPQGDRNEQKNRSRSIRNYYAEVEKEFVLRPAHTPVDDTCLPSGIMNFPSQELNEACDRRNIPPKETYQ